MKLFDLRADFSECCAFLRRNGSAAVWGNGWFEGTPRDSDYPVPQGEREEDRSDGPLPDFTQFNLDPIPTFSARARDLLADFLAPNGEFAAIDLDEPVRYFAYNATTMVDALDETRSEIAWFRSGGVMAVDKYVLLESVRTLPPIFKMPQTRRNTTYVNEELVQRVQASELLGFRFELLYER